MGCPANAIIAFVQQQLKTGCGISAYVNTLHVKSTIQPSRAGGLVELYYTYAVRRRRVVK